MAQFKVQNFPKSSIQHGVSYQRYTMNALPTSVTSYLSVVIRRGSLSPK